MNVAHVGLVHCDSYRCKFRGFHTISFYERKVKRKLVKIASSIGFFGEI